MVYKALNTDLVSYFVEFIPYMSAFIQDEFSFAITDNHKFLKFIPSEHIHPDIKEGDKIGEGSSSYECLRTGKPVSKILPKHIFGVEIKSIAVPIKDESDNIIGTVSIGKSLKQQNEIKELSASLSGALSQISQSIGHISSGVQDIVLSNEQNSKLVEFADNEAQNTDSILRFIKTISDETNLLGLNAAIESARVGEAGRGFRIVAQEIRKLSKSSSESAGKIEDVIRNIQTSVGSIRENINHSNATFQEQAAAIEEITAAIEELDANAKVLEEIASKY